MPDRKPIDGVIVTALDPVLDKAEAQLVLDLRNDLMQRIACARERRANQFGGFYADNPEQTPIPVLEARLAALDKLMRCSRVWKRAVFASDGNEKAPQPEGHGAMLVLPMSADPYGVSSIILHDERGKQCGEIRYLAVLRTRPISPFAEDPDWPDCIPRLIPCGMHIRDAAREIAREDMEAAVSYLRFRTEADYSRDVYSKALSGQPLDAGMTRCFERGFIKLLTP